MEVKCRWCGKEGGCRLVEDPMYEWGPNQFIDLCPECAERAEEQLREKKGSEEPSFDYGGEFLLDPMFWFVVVMIGIVLWAIFGHH